MSYCFFGRYLQKNTGLRGVPFPVIAWPRVYVLLNSQPVAWKERAGPLLAYHWEMGQPAWDRWEIEFSHNIHCIAIFSMTAECAMVKMQWNLHWNLCKKWALGAAKMFSRCNVMDNHCIPCIPLLMAKRAIVIWISHFGIHRHVQSSKFMLRGWTHVLCKLIYLQSTWALLFTVTPCLDHDNVFEIGNKIIWYQPCLYSRHGPLIIAKSNSKMSMLLTSRKYFLWCVDANFIW